MLCCRRPYLESCRGEADELDALFDGEQEERRAAEREAALTSLRQKQRKLLDLHYEDRISAEAFGTEEARIAAQIRALDADAASAAAACSAAPTTVRSLDGAVCTSAESSDHRRELINRARSRRN